MASLRKLKKKKNLVKAHHKNLEKSKKMEQLSSKWNNWSRDNWESLWSFIDTSNGLILSLNWYFMYHKFLKHLEIVCGNMLISFIYFPGQQITVFHISSEENQDIDVAILRALLQG